MHSAGKSRQVWVKDWSQQVEHIQVPNGTGPDVRRSPLLLLIIELYSLGVYEKTLANLG